MVDTHSSDSFSKRAIVFGGIFARFVHHQIHVGIEDDHESASQQSPTGDTMSPSCVISKRQRLEVRSHNSFNRSGARALDVNLEAVDRVVVVTRGRA
jgi:hypothetical protein